MRRPEGTIVAALASLWLAGCATSALEMAPARPDKPWVPATTASGEIIAGKQPAPATADGYVLPGNSALANVPQPPTIDAGKAYSLPELIDLAESNNPVTRIAWNDARRAALAAGIAEAAFLPKITATVVGGYQRSDGRQSTLGTSFDSNSTVNGTVSAVSLQWLLFDFGQRAAVVEAAKQVSVISNIAFTAAHQQLIYAVTVAFYNHAAAQARLTTATQSLANAKTVQSAAEDRYAHKIGTVTEVAQARQSTAQANLAVVQATGGAQDAYLALLTAMGISPFTKIKVADISGRKLSPSMAATIDSMIAKALAQRPDVQSAYAAEKASLATVRAAKAEFMPKIFASATGTYNSGNLNTTLLAPGTQQPTAVNTNGNHLGGSLIAGVTVPLYDGGTRTASLTQARAAADSAHARMTQVRQDAVRQIVVADNALRTSLAAHTASESLETAARTTFDAALAAYRSGVGSITDLTLAENQLLQAKNASTDAYSTALSSAATLALSTGALGAAPQ
ncbi:MAG: outer rane efflux protein [Rhodospirillales bacterium]|jgi:outer membrane protein|nr:outer rane efflux protein [Rhodospirillales bacterium]